MKLREYYRDNELRVRCPINSAVDIELQRQTAYAMTLPALAKTITVCIVEGEQEDCFPPSVTRPPTRSIFAFYKQAWWRQRINERIRARYNNEPPYTKEELLNEKDQ
jgi:hypothetical protein